MLSHLKARFADVKTISALCQRAEAIANSEGLEEPGAEHFVLAACELPDGTARAAFAATGVTIDGLKASIAQQYSDALASVGIDLTIVSPNGAAPWPADTSGPYRASPTGQHLVRELARRSDKDRPLAGAHIVAVAAEMPHGVIARAFARLNVGRARLREAAEQQLALL